MFARLAAYEGRDPAGTDALVEAMRGPASSGGELEGLRRLLLLGSRDDTSHLDVAVFDSSAALHPAERGGPEQVDGETQHGREHGELRHARQRMPQAGVRARLTPDEALQLLSQRGPGPEPDRRQASLQLPQVLRGSRAPIQLHGGPAQRQSSASAEGSLPIW